MVASTCYFLAIMKMRTTIIILLLVHSNSLLLSQDSWRKNIDSLLEKNIIEHKIKGLSVGIVFKDNIQYSKGFGKLNEKSNELISGETPFLAASISKLFVATAIIQLQERGLIDINQKVIKYIPEFSMKDERFKEITVKQLLNHTSGLSEGSPYRWDKVKNKNLDIKNFTLSLSKRRLLFNPGERFSYSNTGYVVLGYLIEKITNQNFATYIQDNILNQANMTNSHFDMFYFNKLLFPEYINSKGKIQECCIANTSPSGNLISSATDLSKWILLNLRLYNSFPEEDSSFITKASQTLLWTPTQTFEGSKTTLGLGWWQYNSEKYGKSVFHSGHYTNFSVSNLVIFPEQNFGFVILCNDEAAMEVVYNQLSDGITEIVPSLLKE